jgi:hypothetical protein
MGAAKMRKSTKKKTIKKNSNGSKATSAAGESTFEVKSKFGNGVNLVGEEEGSVGSELID